MAEAWPRAHPCASRAALHLATAGVQGRGGWRGRGQHLWSRSRCVLPRKQQRPLLKGRRAGGQPAFPGLPPAAADAASLPGPQLAVCAAGPEDEAKWAAFDAMVESWLGGSKPRAEVASYAEQEEEEAASNVLCARCYSLRHYGWVMRRLAAAGQQGRTPRRAATCSN